MYLYVCVHVFMLMMNTSRVTNVCCDVVCLYTLAIMHVLFVCVCMCVNAHDGQNSRLNRCDGAAQCLWY